MDAVPDAQELRERLRSPLRRELRAGCRDDVVVGGLERLIRTVGTPFAEVRTLLAGYAEMAPEMRQERVRQALGSLDRSAAANPGPHASPGPPDKGDGPRSGAAEKGGGPGATRLLEARLHEVDIGLAAQAGRKLAELGVATHRDLLRVFPAATRIAGLCRTSPAWPGASRPPSSARCWDARRRSPAVA